MAAAEERQAFIVGGHRWESCDKGKSLCIFGPESELRQFCGKIATNKWFDYFILSLILIGTICLAIDSPVYCTQEWCDVLEIIDLVINVIFTIEMCLRIIYMGFYMSKTAYLQDGWFVLDFLVVITGWLSMMDGFPNFKPFRAFKALKTVKAIRLLSYCAAVRIQLKLIAAHCSKDLALVRFLAYLAQLLGDPSLSFGLRFSTHACHLCNP